MVWIAKGCVNYYDMWGKRIISFAHTHKCCLKHVRWQPIGEALRMLGIRSRVEHVDEKDRPLERAIPSEVDVAVNHCRAMARAMTWAKSHRLAPQQLPRQQPIFREAI